jgi:hypothetical protein
MNKPTTIIACLLIALTSFIFAPNKAQAYDEDDVMCIQVAQELDENCNVVGERVLGGICLARQVISCLRNKVAKCSTSELLESYSDISNSLGICEEKLQKSRKRIRRLRQAK